LKERVTLIDAPVIELSSTQIRERLSKGQSVRYYVPDKVLDYIERKHLYRKQEQQE
jgi:nicotinate-nucleotide adenylyltransferase